VDLLLHVGGSGLDALRHGWLLLMLHLVIVLVLVVAILGSAACLQP
jgi:hypothetical protein